MKNNIQYLDDKAKSIRKSILKMGANQKAIHLGGGMSCVEILVSLYFEILNHDHNNPNWLERDRFILSKGHAVIALYATLAECGYFPKSLLETFKEFQSPLQGHPDKLSLSGIEMSTGSLGQGLSVGIGLAISAKLSKESYKTYVLLGDGELNEGQVWEAAMAASNFKLDNLLAIVDRNQLQLDGRTEDIMKLEPLIDKWLAFGWYVFETNGHSYDDLISTFNKAKSIKDKPVVLIAHTIKGKGLSCFENMVNCHSVKLNSCDLGKCLDLIDNYPI
jgi:transketolase